MLIEQTMCYRSTSEAYHAALAAGLRAEDFRNTWDVFEEITHEHDGMFLSCSYGPLDFAALYPDGHGLSES